VRYVVHVQRLVRLRLSRHWTLGPYRFLWVARLVAWLETIDGDNVCQGAVVERVERVA